MITNKRKIDNQTKKAIFLSSWGYKILKYLEKQIDSAHKNESYVGVLYFR